MFDTVLIANRGAIATRILRTLKAMGIKSVAVYHAQDANSLHVQMADLAICLGEGSASETYLNIPKILQAAKESGAQAIHPGYGFLSENQTFVRECEAAGLVFIGPTIEQMALFGLKHSAREAAEAAQVPLVPGSPLLDDLAHAHHWAQQVGFPVMLKSTAGGGGIGMQVCHSSEELTQAWDSVRRLGGNYFSNNGVFLEAYIANARHIEVQIFGDGQGLAVALGERDCSAQRRNQKVIEETPAPNLSQPLREALLSTAEALMASVQYRNAGTVEFIYDTDRQAFYFLEVNTRLQVEHGVTEMVWGVDLVNWMIRQAAGELDLAYEHSKLSPQGHAMQARIYAEAPHLDFRPSSGRLTLVDWPEEEGLRLDTWVESGLVVPSLFDPMLAKVICHSSNRAGALEQLHGALSNSELFGIETNLPYLRQLLQSPLSLTGQLLTRSLASFDYQPACISVLNGGTQTTLQDYPGRIGYWHVGVPPSGPMDSLSFRLANQLLGNELGAPALEITLNGPTLKFHRDTQVAITGAQIELSLDGNPCPQYENFWVKADQVLAMGRVQQSGCRAYLAVAGGFDCPDYLGSAATFTLGQFGGLGRALATGDTLHLQEAATPRPPATLAEKLRPHIDTHWTLRVIPGPHTAPEFFTEEDMARLFAEPWHVHYQSSRTGVRLIGSKPQWARETGGEAGLHPSNIHDNAYAFGSVDFTGDMPVILGVDGPSLGGFVCPATVITADLWKLGQLKAGDQLRFEPVTHTEAVSLEAIQLHRLRLCDGSETALAAPSTLTPPALNNPIVQTGHFGPDAYACRLAGDHFLLVELGPLELDIARRFRVHALMLWMQENPIAGVQELTPGVRSLQIHYNPQFLPLAQLLHHLRLAEAELARAQPQSLPSRTVYLPLSWDDQACRDAIAKYTANVRPGAPWCPSNLEFIRRINGLTDIAAVKDMFFKTDYLVLGLGDVYLGAPLATPLDPRQRLVTTKYNPARTWTAENSVGIGGAYLCVYGMEGPGGYQFVGRTLQMWNTYKTTEAFSHPWLLRFFDQIRFYEVSAEELKTIRQDFPQGRYPLRIEESEFNLKDYQAFLDQNKAGIDAFTRQREAAFAAELEHWRQTGQLTYTSHEDTQPTESASALPSGTTAVESPVAGSLWQLAVAESEVVKAGQVVAVLESMKMEIEVTAPVAGRVSKILRQPGQSLALGQTLLWISQELAS